MLPVLRGRLFNMSYHPPIIQYKRITLSANQIKALHTTPIDVLSAPGAGKTIFPISASAVMTNTATAYSGASKIGLFFDSYSGEYSMQSFSDEILTNGIILGDEGVSYNYTSPTLIALANASGPYLKYIKGTSDWWDDISNKALKIGLTPKTAQAYLTGGTSATSVIATWNAVTNGSFRVTINGVQFDVTGMDFSGAGILAMADVAGVIQTALRTATGDSITVTWDTNHFIITTDTDTAGFNNSITVLSATGSGTDLSGAGATDFMDCDTGHGTVTAATFDPFITGTGTAVIHFWYQVVDVA